MSGERRRTHAADGFKAVVVFKSTGWHCRLTNTRHQTARPALQHSDDWRADRTLVLVEVSFNLNLKWPAVAIFLSHALMSNPAWLSLPCKSTAHCSARHINNPTLTTACTKSQQRAFRLVPSFLPLSRGFAQLSAEHKWHCALFLWQDICCFQLASRPSLLECVLCSPAALK